MMFDDTVRLVCVYMLLLTDNEFSESQSWCGQVMSLKLDYLKQMTVPQKYLL